MATVTRDGNRTGASKGARSKASKGAGGKAAKGGASKASNGAGGKAAKGGASTEGNGTKPRAGERKPIEAILKDAGLAGNQRWLPGLTPIKLGARLARRPDTVAKAGLGLAGELTKIAIGRSEVGPSKADRRFKDPAWKKNPGFRRLGQAYVAAGEAVDGLVSGLGLDWRTERRVRFAAENVLDAIAPTNFPLSNPTVLKAVIDSGGLNFVQGAQRLAGDLRNRPLLPSSVDGSEFEVGENLGVTPGSVVLRTEVFELIQYDPQTEKVREKPLLLVPQMINKYYITDLAPGRSMMEHAVQQGQQVFAMSWRNPDERHADWNFDTYCQAVLDALDAVEKASGSDETHILGLCAGGNVAAVALAHMAASGQLDRIAGLTLGVTVLDWRKAGTTGAFLDDSIAALAMASSGNKGYLDGKSLASVFAWMRPNDMIWGYVVNNYLLGKPPPAFDVLYWNADQTNMPAGLHRDFIEIGLGNALATPGTISVLGTPIDLSKITVDTYAIAAISDHIVPWKSAYNSTELLGSTSRFVLSTSGHVVALVNPPGNEQANFQTNEAMPEDPDEWLAGAETHKGTWWPDWTDWLGERSGEEKDAPKEPGGGELPVLGEAPGTYVRATA